MDPQKKNALFPKMVIIAVLIVVTWVSTLLVLAVVIDRSERADTAASEIATKWSREQTLTGPVITIPTRTTEIFDGREMVREGFIFLLPETLNYDVSLETATLSRGIFDAVVYTGNVTATGEVDLDEINLGEISGTIQWSGARLSIGIPDTRGITSETKLLWNNGESSFEPGVASTIIGTTGISAPITINRNSKDNSFSFDLTLRGSAEINFVPLGKTTNVSISSNWPSPSFSGEFLPANRELTNSGFSADWAISSFGRSLPQTWSGTESANNETIEQNIQNATFGVALHQDVDFYTQVNRSIKYSILFISLTFLAFFMFEVLGGLQIHPMNYLLVGLAIALFYLLLLSFSENIGFLSAYALSTLAITGLITGYCKAVLKAKKRAGIIAILLLALYAYLYVLLQLDELSLIFGSVFLFVILATVMYLTRNIDWYEIPDRR